MNKKDFRDGYHNGKKEVIDVMNQAINIFWEVWKTSATFKSVVMKDVYNSLNKKRPEFISEIVVANYEHRGAAPIIYDIKHMTPLLCENQDREMILDVVF